MRLWIAMVAAGLSYSQVAAAAQAPESTHRAAKRRALYPDSPILAISGAPNQAVSADHRVPQDSGPSNARLAQELEKPASDYSPPATPPPVSYLPGSILWQSDGPPLVIYPGFVPIEGSFVGGPGISFGLGYRIGFIGGPR